MGKRSNNSQGHGYGPTSKLSISHDHLFCDLCESTNISKSLNFLTIQIDTSSSNKPRGDREVNSSYDEQISLRRHSQHTLQRRKILRHSYRCTETSSRRRYDSIARKVWAVRDPFIERSRSRTATNVAQSRKAPTRRRRRRTVFCNDGSGDCFGRYADITVKYVAFQRVHDDESFVPGLFFFYPGRKLFRCMEEIPT